MTSAPRRPPALLRLALRIVRAVGLIVPRRERSEWTREWEGEIRRRESMDGDRVPIGDQIEVVQRSLGSVFDAAWLRRQFTRDSEWLGDLRHTLRLMRGRPAFFGLAVLVLAVGIGSATAVFSVVDAMLLQELPYPESDRLVAIWQNDTSRPSIARGEVALGNFLDWQAGTSTFEGMATAEPYSMDFTGGEQPEVFFATNVSEGFFDILRIRPLHGQLFRPEHHVAGQHTVAVLGYELWTRRFGSDPAIVGRTIPLDGVPFTVMGVLPPIELDLLDAPASRDLWMPKVFQEYELQRRGDGWWAAIGRLAPGVTIDRAQADLDVVSARLAEDFPATNADTRAVIEPLVEHLIGDARPALTLLLGAVLVVLLVACANVANMLLARTVDRDREFAVRGALGAGRGRLVRQVLTESLIVSMTGAALGLALAWWLVRLVVALAPPDIARLATATIDWRLGLFAAAIGIAAGVLSGLAPAWQFSRPQRPEALGAGRGSIGTRGARFVRDGLAVAEIALAVALVLGAGLLLQSFTRLLDVNPGFKVDNILALQVFAWDRDNSDARTRAAFFRETMAELGALPGVVDVGAVSAMPFIAANINIQGGFTIDGRPALRENELPQAHFTVATPGYFSVMGIPLVEGRNLSVTDGPGAELAAVISDAMARAHWPDGGAVGSWLQFRFTGTPVRVRVVGVVSELRHDALDQPGRHEIFLSHAQVAFGSMTYVIQTAQDPATVAEAAKRVIWSHDPLLTFYDTTTVPQLVAASVAPRRFSLTLVGGFAIAALLLAAAGIYGVLSFVTQRQTREFGVRMALGATAREVALMVLRRGLRLGAIGLVLGLLAATLVWNSAQAMLFDISPFDPLTIGAVAAVMLGVAVLSCYVPARRAMRVDPVSALRE